MRKEEEEAGKNWKHIKERERINSLKIAFISFDFIEFCLCNICLCVLVFSVNDYLLRKFFIETFAPAQIQLNNMPF